MAADEQILKSADHLASDGPALLDFFRNRTVQGADQNRLDRLIRQLGHDDFEMRERASEELMVLGPVARPLLVSAVQPGSRGCSSGAGSACRTCKRGSAPRSLRQRPACWRCKPAGTAEVLFAYLPFADDETVAGEIRKALVAVALPDGKPEPVLRGGLTDPSPIKRAGAAIVLLNAGVAEARPAIQKLLQGSGTERAAARRAGPGREQGTRCSARPH